MEFVNATDMVAGYTLGLDPSGRESLVVVLKGTFGIPADGDEPRLLDEQVPLVDSDTFEGEPGFSAPVYEADYAPVKPKCDVLLLGCAYAPRGRATAAVNASLEVGPIRKTIRVVGERRWNNFLFWTWPGRPKPFKTMPISYGRAFGGVDPVPAEPKLGRTYLPNHVGVGYSVSLWGRGRMTKLPAPNTEQPGKPVRGTRGRYRPMSFGPVGRAWLPRPRWAGTYDQKWLDEVMPFLPKDFDTRYFQCAPEDQQMPYPQGGETVKLTGLTPEGRCAFRLPRLDVPLEFDLRDEKEMQVHRPVVDTLVIEPDLRRFSMVWRFARPLKRNLFEVQRVIAGRMPAGWYHARRTGKNYAGSVGATVRTQVGVMEPGS